MLKWIFTLLLGVAILSAIGPRIRWLGRLPGDITFVRDGRRYFFPFGTAIMASMLVSLLYWSLR
jgi:hypothetical protein